MVKSAFKHCLICLLHSIPETITFFLLTRTYFWHRWLSFVWFRSHLSDKIQTVAVNGLRADETPLPFGVPQGSVLGPVLCVLYARPRFELIKKHSIQHHTFADDNQLYKETVLDQIQTTTDYMQNCLTDVKLWMAHNKLQLNDSKTECMVVKSCRLSLNFPFLLQCVLEIQKCFLLLWKILVSHLIAT